MAWFWESVLTSQMLGVVARILFYYIFLIFQFTSLIFHPCFSSSTFIEEVVTYCFEIIYSKFPLVPIRKQVMAQTKQCQSTSLTTSSKDWQVFVALKGQGSRQHTINNLLHIVTYLISQYLCTWRR